ncbi:MAG TPA: hypothetical protein VN713_00215 [Sphingomicrobium sp.]|nr:hypothetical protein [Sphingomicrobium sp.]
MRVSLHPGVWIGTVGLWITGGLTVTVYTLPTQIQTYRIGEAAIALGFLLFVWGVKWEGQHWWYLAWRRLTKRDAPPLGFIDRHEADESRATPRWTHDNSDDEWDYQANNKPVQRDTSLGEGLAYLATGQWGQDMDAALVEMFNTTTPNYVGDVHQRAFDGKLTVWGRFNRSDIYRPIPVAHWSNHSLDGNALMLNGFARTWGHDGESYIDLMVSRSQIEDWRNEERP